MSRRLQPDVWRDFNVQVFERAGVPPEDAERAAAVRLESTLRQGAGLDVFSVVRLRNTLRRLSSRGINPTPQLRTVREQGNLVLVDGDNGLGAVVGTQAMAQGVERAKSPGLALVGVRNSTTLGMMAYYAMLALPDNMIGFVATNTELKIGLPPWGGMTPALGNNPFAVAVPMRESPPLVLDMSVIATRPQGEAAIEASSSRAPLGSTFMSRPVIGDHKGYGLALTLEVLTGVLTGAGFGQAHAPERLESPGVQHDLGHLFGVLNPAVFMPLEHFLTRMEQLRQEIVQIPVAPGFERITLPGELEHERRLERLVHGIPVQDDALAALQELCASLDLVSPPAE